MTVFAPGDGEEPPAAVAFLADIIDTLGDSGVVRIHRIPQLDRLTTPDAADSRVAPGQ